MLARCSRLWLAGTIVGLAACGDDSSGGPPIDPSATEPTTVTMTTADTSGSTGTTGASTGSSSGAETTTTGSTSGVDTSTGTGGPSNCGELLCTGHGACELDVNGMPQCVCDPGYVLDVDGVSCGINYGCVQVRFLEDSCRQIVNGPPAVALYFAVDFCSGDAVTPELREKLGLEFQVLENGEDITGNVESFSTILATRVESYVTLVIDVSESVTENQDLPALVDELRTFVTQLTPGMDDPDVYVSVYVFARSVAEYVPFTRDLGAVDAALAAIATDPAPVVLLAGNGDGSDLYDGVEIGINRTQRIRELRDAVSWGGVLTTGTIVVVTDGNDESNGSLDTQLIDSTTNNVVSIGISDAINDEDLQAIGRDASFLAPTPMDWGMAFAEIAERVDQYPERSYLLAYCSPATEGTPSVEVTVTGIGVETATSAVCEFDADVFSSDPLDVCDKTFFALECTSPRECGGLSACGACNDDECCDGETCRAPMDAFDAAVSCVDQPELCASDDEVCNVAEDECQPPAPYNAGTCSPGCDPGVHYCGPEDECIDVLASGVDCSEPEQCPELNCSRENPDNLLESRVCRERALLHDYCGPDEAICEQGGYCVGGECEPKLLPNENCSSDQNCRTGVCVNLGPAGNRCDDRLNCFWSWDEKVPS